MSLNDEYTKRKKYEKQLLPGKKNHNHATGHYASPYQSDRRESLGLTPKRSSPPPGAAPGQGAGGRATRARIFTKKSYIVSTKITKYKKFSIPVSNDYCCIDTEKSH